MSLACATCPVRDRAACAVLSEAERDDLARRGRHRTLAAGDVLFHAGEKADTCATLTSGNSTETLKPADTARYPADVAHSIAAPEGPLRAFLVVHYG